ncbi:MAG: AraC family transcriptional regulator [Pseudomonadota bacterium]
MGDPISRDRMLSIMETRFLATVEERPVRRWRNVDTVLIRQQTKHCAGTLGFHLLEQCAKGRARTSRIEGTDRGDAANAEHVPGTLSYFQSDVPQSFEIEGDFVIQQVYVDDAIFRATASALATGDPDRLDTLGFQGVFDPRIKGLVDALLEEARNPSAGGDLYVDSLAQRIAELIFWRHHDRALRRTQRRRTLSDAEIARVSEYLEAHLADTGGLDTVAGLLEMDPFAFARAFKETTGLAPHQYLIDRRISRVKDLLLRGQEGLADIAYITGFSSQSHMTATFKKRVGVAPGQWRSATRSEVKVG